MGNSYYNIPYVVSSHQKEGIGAPRGILPKLKKHCRALVHGLRLITTSNPSCRQYGYVTITWPPCLQQPQTSRGCAMDITNANVDYNNSTTVSYSTDAQSKNTFFVGHCRLTIHIGWCCSLLIHWGPP